MSVPLIELTVKAKSSALTRNECLAMCRTVRELALNSNNVFACLGRELDKSNPLAMCVSVLAGALVVNYNKARDRSSEIAVSTIAHTADEP